MVRNKDKNHNTLTSFNPKSSASSTGARLGNGSCDQSTTTPLFHSLHLTLLFAPHSFPWLQHWVFLEVCRGTWTTSSFSPLGALRTFSPIFPSQSWLWAQLCLALGQQDPAVYSKGSSGCQSLGTCSPADPQTGFITRAHKAVNSLGKLGNAVSSNLSSGRCAPSAISLSVSVHKVGTLNWHCDCSWSQAKC